jgi:Ribbon-helix-helix protein, copG family.
MKNVTVRLRKSVIDQLDDEADEIGVSRSQYVRDILDNRHRADRLQDYLQAREERIETLEDRLESREERIETLEDRLESREERIETLEEQLAQRSELEGKVEDLPEKIRDSDEPDPPFPVNWLRWWQRR